MVVPVLVGVIMPVVVAVEVKGAGAGTAEDDTTAGDTSTASTAGTGARRSSSTADRNDSCFFPFFFCSCMGQSDDTADEEAFLHPGSQTTT